MDIIKECRGSSYQKNQIIKKWWEPSFLLILLNWIFLQVFNGLHIKWIMNQTCRKNKASGQVLKKTWNPTTVLLYLWTSLKNAEAWGKARKSHFFHDLLLKASRCCFFKEETFFLSLSHWTDWESEMQFSWQIWTHFLCYLTDDTLKAL